ncbi:MAG: ABC transporter substrate-binding protein [Deltaproteobacteria bacterium]|nr:ABC transporter substrate-binding protein [Deltaproteobacteria bacterium]
MQKFVSILCVLFFVFIVSPSALAGDKFDEASLYKAAKKEGEVNIYSYSSRVFKFGKTFEKQYPGIKVNGFDIDSSEIITKVIAEQTAQNYVVDVIFLKDPATVMHELYNRKMVFGYVPSDLKGLIPKRFQKPLLVHHGSVDALIYNNAKMSAAPIDSLWDLTKKEWKGRFIFPDPQKMPEFVEVLATIVEHSKEMAADYKRVFGKKIKLSPGVKNAGYEWILRVLNNDLIIAGSTNSVAKAVGLSEQVNPPVGLTAFSRLRDKRKNPNLKFDIMYNIKPVMGVSTDVVVGIVNHAKHPNAAKLLIRWMMGDEKGGQGYSPYYVLGNFSVIKDVPPPKGSKSLSDLNLWASDRDFVWNNGQKILDFWVSHLR